LINVYAEHNFIKQEKIADRYITDYSSSANLVQNVQLPYHYDILQRADVWSGAYLPMKLLQSHCFINMRTITMFQSRLLCEYAQFEATDHLLVLNSALDPIVTLARQRLVDGHLYLAEDNVAALTGSDTAQQHHLAFHSYILHHSAGTMDVAAMNLLYQPSNAWMHYALSVAAFALKLQGRLYVAGAKDRGILTIAKRMQELFGNVETLAISKGQRVLCATKRTAFTLEDLPVPTLRVFADNTLDAGTSMLLDALEIPKTATALDIGCGAGFIGLHIAQQAVQGHVTMLDASLAAVDASRMAVEKAQLTNVQVMASDAARAVSGQHFDLIATNPPFHQGGIQTLAIAERFIRESAQILLPDGHFYLVANRFLKYEPVLSACFNSVQEVAGDTRYKVLRASHPGKNK
jgi:16S rRNA (guanine1207-N2)-methyltransferase